MATTTTATDLTSKLEDLIKNITARNQETQTQKEGGGAWGYIVALILSLVNVIAIAVAMYYANKQAKELADAKTALEQQAVDLEQKKHETAQAVLQGRIVQNQAEIQVLEANIAARTTTLTKLEAEHAIRMKRVQELKSWEAMTHG